MCCFAHNDISMLLNFYFWQPFYYLIDPEDQSFGVKSKEVPTKLIADNAPMYRGWNITKYLRDFVVSIGYCETKYQNQNPAENRYQTVK